MNNIDIDSDFDNLDTNKIEQINVKDILGNLDYIEKRLQGLYELNEFYLDQLNNYSNKIIDHETKLLLIEESKNYYVKAIDLLYENSVGELEKIVNLALEYIYYDTKKQIKIELQDKRGKSLSFFIVDPEGNEVNIEDEGTGVRTIVSFILHVYYLINKNSTPFLFLDEKLAGISQEYISRFFSFVHSLCKNKNLALVCISHDPRIISYANKIYNVGNGIVSELIPEQQN